MTLISHKMHALGVMIFGNLMSFCHAILAKNAVKDQKGQKKLKNYMKYLKNYMKCLKNYMKCLFFSLQYLELRYNSRVVRLLASFSFIVSLILYMGVVLYAPCLALHTITGLPVVALILLGGIVATIYTVMVI